MLLQNQLAPGELAPEQEVNRLPPRFESFNIHDFFPLIMCVNLARRRDRWQQMQARFKASQITGVMRFSAIDGARLSVPDCWPSTSGAYGCLQSHVAVVELARDLGVSSVLIFEDDVEFAEDFQQKLQTVLAQLPDNWQMFFLGAIELDDPVPVAMGVSRLTKAYSTYAYAIHHSLFDTFIQLNKNSQQLLDINSFLLQQRFNCYCASPYLAWVESGYSDAQEKIENHWYLRESLVLFGQSANELLASSCVFIHLEADAGKASLDNLYFLLEYYFQYFQGHLSVCVLEQGESSVVNVNRLPENTRHWLLSPGNAREHDFARAAGKFGKAFDYLILSSNGLYLQPMDFRGNLQMCRRHQLCDGFSRRIQLTAKDSQILKQQADGRGLNLSAYQAGEKKNTAFDRLPGTEPSCYFFIETGLLLKLAEEVLAQDKPVPGTLETYLQGLPCFDAPNFALALSG